MGIIFTENISILLHDFVLSNVCCRGGVQKSEWRLGGLFQNGFT